MNRATIQVTSVFLVSGGARGITADCVIYLARQYHCKFILLGRSSIAEPEPAWASGVSEDTELKKRIMEHLKAIGEKPTPLGTQKVYNGIIARREIEATLNAIREAGSTVEYVSADVTDAAALRQKTAEAARRLGPITGIIHGAGNLADKLIEHKTEKDFETVYTAKVHGLENLLDCVPAEQLQYLVLFSSVAGFFGNVGQTDYAIANEILNKAAYQVKRRAPACRVVSINWGPWDAGMVTPQLQQYFEQHQIKVIPVEVGAQMLFEELEFGNQDVVQVVIGSTINVVTKQDSDELRTHRIRRKLVLEESPILGDHVVNGQAVLPMVCALTWAANTLEQLYPGYKFFKYLNYKILKGIVFDETLADEYILDLKEVAKSEADGELTVDAMIWANTPDGKPRFHYSMQLVHRREIPSAPIYDRFDLTNSLDISGEKAYADKILFHGWSFQGINRVLNISTERTTSLCIQPIVPERYQGQFPIQAFNYFGVDSALQSLGIFGRVTYEVGSLPLSAASGESYRYIPFETPFYVSLETRAITDTGITGDLYLHDENGLIYFIAYGSKVLLSKRLIELFFLNTLPEPIPYNDLAGILP
jgi:NAD(P)-dependent dehydrogenase (short-subunit alcohol dehydrogenase family)